MEEQPFLGVLAKLCKACVSFVMSVRSYVQPFACNKLAPIGPIFMTSDM